MYLVEILLYTAHNNTTVLFVSNPVSLLSSRLWGEPYRFLNKKKDAVTIMSPFSTHNPKHFSKGSAPRPHSGNIQYLRVRVARNAHDPRNVFHSYVTEMFKCPRYSQKKALLRYAGSQYAHAHAVFSGSRYVTLWLMPECCLHYGMSSLHKPIGQKCVYVKERHTIIIDHSTS